MRLRSWSGRGLIGAVPVLALVAAGALLADGVTLEGPARTAEASALGTYVDGPPPGFTGGFGEGSCHACHFSEDENRPGGKILVEGFPERFASGEEYPLAITLARRDMALAGFQLAVRFERDGTQAGALSPDDDTLVGIVADRDLVYAYQRADGAVPTSPDTARWTVVWTAPVESGTVVLNVAGNAADGDDSADGDFVYTLELESGGSQGPEVAEK